MGNYKIFIVEDDNWYGEILNYHLSLNPDYEIIRFGSAKNCLNKLAEKPNLITIDYSLPDMNGLELLKKIKLYLPEIPVVVISGQEEVNTAVELIKNGAADYITKDDNTKDLLWNAIIRIRENQSLKQEVEYLKEELGKKYEFDKTIKGNSTAIKKIFGLLEKATKTNINVSVSGETGTGKELVAKAIHYNSDRRKKNFVAVNMAAIPKDLVESELFGHEKGSFTGAISRKIGKFEEADKGTIFLDEIAEADLNLQTKLLRVLQEKEIVRVGSNEVVKLDVRIIVATHKNLANEVKKGNFREDLYYRVIGLPIELPPLRDRETDILLLAKYFADNFCKENKMLPLHFTNEACSKLMSYHFQGNIRELKAIVDLAAVMCDGKEITPDDIIFNAAKGNDFFITEEKNLRDYTNFIVSHYLKKYDNDIIKVAEKLAIGKSTIYKMLKNGDIFMIEKK